MTVPSYIRDLLVNSFWYPKWIIDPNPLCILNDDRVHREDIGWHCGHIGLIVKPWEEAVISP